MMPRLTINLDGDAYDRLERLAAEKRRTAAAQAEVLVMQAVGAFPPEVTLAPKPFAPPLDIAPPPD